MQEIWKRLTDFTNYEISNLGRLRNKKGQILKQSADFYGYIVNGLWKKNKTRRFRVHRLVAQYFIENPLNKESVNHIDGNKENNRIENLEWVTAKENAVHAFKIGLVKVDMGENHYRSVLTESQVIDIYNCCKNKLMRDCDLARKYNVTEGAIRRIKTKKIWKHILKDLP